MSSSTEIGGTSVNIAALPPTVEVFKESPWRSLPKTPASVVPVSAITHAFDAASNYAKVYVSGERGLFLFSPRDQTGERKDIDLIWHFTAAGIKPVEFRYQTVDNNGRPPNEYYATTFVNPDAVNYIRVPQHGNTRLTIHLQGEKNFAVTGLLSKPIDDIVDLFRKAKPQLMSVPLADGDTAYIVPSKVAAITLADAPLAERMASDLKCVTSRGGNRNQFTAVYAPRKQITFKDGNRLQAQGNWEPARATLQTTENYPKHFGTLQA